jgi:hypothetical protein
MPHEIDVDFQQDLPSYLNALKQYDIQYGPKAQNLQGLGGQNFQVRTSDFAPGYGYVNPENDALFPLYPETGGFEQPNPGLPHPDPLGEPPPLQGRLNYWTPWAGGDDYGMEAAEKKIDKWGRDITFEGQPYYSPYAGGDDGPSYGVYAGGDEF